MLALAQHLAQNGQCICLLQIKTSQKDQSQTSLPAETFPFREGKSSLEILKEKNDNQHVYSNWGEGGGVEAIKI